MLDRVPLQGTGSSIQLVKEFWMGAIGRLVLIIVVVLATDWVSAAIFKQPTLTTHWFGEPIAVSLDRIDADEFSSGGIFGGYYLPPPFTGEEYVDWRDGQRKLVPNFWLDVRNSTLRQALWPRAGDNAVIGCEVGHHLARVLTREGVQQSGPVGHGTFTVEDMTFTGIMCDATTDGSTYILGTEGARAQYLELYAVRIASGLACPSEEEVFELRGPGHWCRMVPRRGNRPIVLNPTQFIRVINNQSTAECWSINHRNVDGRSDDYSMTRVNEYRWEFVSNSDDPVAVYLHLSPC